MANMNPGFPNGVGLLNHFQNGALGQALDGLELSEVVQRVSIQLQRETGTVARLFAIHQELMDFLHKFHRRDLDFLTMQ